MDDITSAKEAEVRRFDEEQRRVLACQRAGRIPVHVGIIMDGNGRWAQKRGLKRQEGHRAGVQTIYRCIPAVIKLGIRHCTLFVFSTENWKRPREEVQFLFGLITDYCRKHKDELIEHGVQVIPIGRWKELPASAVHSIESVVRDTRQGSRLSLYLAINYGGRQEIVDAAAKLAKRLISEGQVDFDGITHEDFADCLYTRGVPDPDLIIRTSGEQRISNFLLWQGAYSELVFTDVLWPGFQPVDLYKAVVEYSSRSRRFGDVTDGRG